MKISGFISYSHSDGKELTDDLYNYLVNLLPNFHPIYDENVLGGEKIEKNQEKLSLCNLLIVIITPATLNSNPITEEINLAKKLDLKIIPCKDKYVKERWDELPWDISAYKGIDFENKGELKRKLVYSLSKILDELSQELKPTKTKIESSKQIENIVPLVVMTDKSVYMYNTDMICTLINPNQTSSNPMNLKIFNEDKKLVYKNSIPLNPKGNGIYQEVILIGGEQWASKPGAEYLIVAEHEGHTAELRFFIADFGMTIELDQKVYTWTDKVYMTIVAPDLNFNSKKTERIGTNTESSITISTKLGNLTNYEFVETGTDTGIFTGEVRLTGFGNYDATGQGKIKSEMGITRGLGPNKGMIGADADDGIRVTLTTPYNTVTGSALIRWNIGEVQWMQSQYKMGDTGTFVIIDPDMNLNPDLIDMFKVRIWSDSDPVGTEILVIETGNETGIFSGDIQFGNETHEGASIKTSPGECVNVEYIDRTLPSPYKVGDEIKVIGTATIKSHEQKKGRP